MRSIGVVAPFSTEESIVAGPMLAAVEAVVAEWLEPTDVVAVDDGRDPARAIEAVVRLAAGGTCIGVVGPKNSGSALAALPAASAARLPLVLPCATADGLTGPGGVAFRLCAPDRATAAAAVALAGRLGVRRLAVLADETDYGRGLALAVRAAARGTPTVIADDVDGADAAFLAMGEVEQAELMRSLRARGYTGTFLSAEGGPAAPIAALAGEAAEGSWLLYPGTPVDGQPVYAAEAADAARILLAAADGGVDAVRRGALHGVTGTIRFTRDGERVGAGVAVYRVVGGRVERSAG